MAIRIYNTKQQELNSNKIAELFLFSTNDFSGLVSNVIEPITILEDGWKWDESLEGKEATLVGNGINIGYDVENTVYTSVGTGVWGFDITIPDSNASIVTNQLSSVNASFQFIEVQSIVKDYVYFIVEYPSGSPATNGYYELLNNEYVLSEDAEVDDTKVYYVRGGENFVVTGAKFPLPQSQLLTTNFEYYGNTVRITDNRFFIPVCGHTSAGYMTMIFNRDKAGYESFLAARTYAYLLKEMGNKFVWRAGGETVGDIGDLNITGNKITNKNHSERNGELHMTALSNLATVIQSPSFTDIRVTPQNSSIAGSLQIAPGTGEVFINRVPVVSILNGGTSATSESQARNNLNIKSGTTTPTSAPKKSDGSTDYGAIYLKIL